MYKKTDTTDEGALFKKGLTEKAEGSRWVYWVLFFSTLMLSGQISAQTSNDQPMVDASDNSGKVPSVVENPKRLNPLTVHFPKKELASQQMQHGEGISALFERSSFNVGVNYYGRATDPKASSALSKYVNKLNTNVLGVSAVMHSGYAWDVVGFDLGAYANFGREHGLSQLLNEGNYTWVDGNGLYRGHSYAAVNLAALKLKFGDHESNIMARAGYLPLNVGTIGTNSGIEPYSYRGFEIKGKYKEWDLGYGWADKFHNEWQKGYYDITSTLTQNRQPDVPPSPVISYIHSVGGRYTFNNNPNMFVDAGVGEAKDFRRNAQIVGTLPVKINADQNVQLTGYVFWGKYDSELGKSFIQGSSAANEYSMSLTAELKQKEWSALVAYGYTRAPDSWSQLFRLAPEGNSDSRNFMQTMAQIDNFTWNGESVIQVGGSWNFGNHINVPGLVLGANAYYGWNMKNQNGPNAGRTGKSNELDVYLAYVAPKGPLKGFSAGIYAAKFNQKDFDGINDQTDIKVVVGYNMSFDTFKNLKAK